MKKFIGLAALVTMLLSGASPLLADSPADAQFMRAMLESMQKQITQMQETLHQQNLRLQQLESSKVLEKVQPNVPVQPAPVPGEPAPWLKGMKMGCDFRLRAEFFDYYDKDNSEGSTGTAADRSRNRYRMRLRWGLEKDLGDDWKTGFRLATGSATDQTSEMQTLGNSGYFTFKNILIDRAYAIYTPTALKDTPVVKDVKVGGGKFENPFLKYSTPIVWDPDVAPEGLYEQACFQLTDGASTKINLYTTAGQFLVNENQANESDAQLWGYQGALNISTKGFNTAKPIDFTLAASFYDYTNWFQTVAGNSSGTSFLRTNTLVADNFRVLDIYPEVVFHVDGAPVSVWYDLAENVANVGAEDLAQAAGLGVHDDDKAWGVGFKIGKAKKKKDWEISWRYAEIGANSVVAAFNDSDFGGPGQTGFTNRKGQKLSLTYQLTDSLAATFSGNLTEPLTPSSAVANSANEKVLRSQFDLDYKF